MTPEPVDQPDLDYEVRLTLEVVVKPGFKSVSARLDAPKKPPEGRQALVGGKLVEGVREAREEGVLTVGMALDSGFARPVEGYQSEVEA